MKSKHCTCVFLRKNFKFDLNVEMSIFGTLYCNIIRWIQLCDKKNLAFVDCCDEILFIKLVLKNVIKLDKGSLNNSFSRPF